MTGCGFSGAHGFAALTLGDGPLPGAADVSFAATFVFLERLGPSSASPKVPWNAPRSMMDVIARTAKRRSSFKTLRPG